MLIYMLWIHYKKKQKLPTRQIYRKYLKYIGKLIVYKFIDGFLSSSVITDGFKINSSIIIHLFKINPSINLSIIIGRS